MARPRRTLKITTIAVALLISLNSASADDTAPEVSFKRMPGRVEVLVGHRKFATYVFQDEQITRPYFCNLYAPCGQPVTRRRPIGEDELHDHPQMHPGLWLAFGDLSGEDYWRLKSPVVHKEFLTPPMGGPGHGTFAVRNRYLTKNQSDPVCEEDCRFTILATRNATIILWDSTFLPDGDSIVFGDQEEMGLGVRLASVIAEKSKAGGLLTNSHGQTTAKQVWGQPARWCDYSGIVGGRPVGITIAGHPDNLRPSWWHARDYGFMAANMFGRQAMQQGQPSRIEVMPGERFRLRYTVIIHNGRPGEGYDPETVATWTGERG